MRGNFSIDELKKEEKREINLQWEERRKGKGVSINRLVKGEKNWSDSLPTAGAKGAQRGPHRRCFL